MSDDPLDSTEHSLDVSTFMEWLDEMADSSGQSREELLETLATSYWTVNEVSRLVEGTGGGDDAGDGAADVRLGEPPAASPGVDVASIVDRLDELDDRVDAIETDDGSKPAESLREELDSLRERVAELEVAFAEEDASGASAPNVDALEAGQDALADRHETLRDRVDTEFRHLRTILEYLLEATDDVDDRADALEDRFDRQIRPLVADLGRLIDLQRTAAHLGVFEADCGFCGNAVDIALLATPRCPHCDRPFGDVEPKQGWFGSPTLVEGDDPRGTGRLDTDGGRATDGRRSPGGQDGQKRPRQGADDDGSAGFEWVGTGE